MMEPKKTKNQVENTGEQLGTGEVKEAWSVASFLSAFSAARPCTPTPCARLCILAWTAFALRSKGTRLLYHFQADKGISCSFVDVLCPHTAGSSLVKALLPQARWSLFHSLFSVLMAAPAAVPAAMTDRAQLLERVRAEFFDPKLQDNNYDIQQVIGEGSYGIVVSAVERQSRVEVAVKRITNVFDDIPEAIRTLRELKFLRLLKNHENIITIRNVLLPADSRTFDDVFVVLELMPTDLTRVLRSKINLSNEHIRWLAYQLLRGVHHIHSANVYHRDLKPSNILINAMCDLRICDFGLARAERGGETPEEDNVAWTDYVATRWYRAPELIMSHYTHYTTKIDMWSLGCILAEMFNNGKPLFPGINAIDQLEKIVNVTGTPTAEGVSAVRNAKARDHLMSIPKRPRRPLCEVLAKVDDPQALSLLEDILQFDPAHRPSAAAALGHPYFAQLHDPDVLLQLAEAIPLHEFDFEKQNLSIDDLRQLFMNEILRYHPRRRDEYSSPCAQVGSLRVDQAARFGEQFRAHENGRAAPPPYASMPSQRLGEMMGEVAEEYSAHTGGMGAAASSVGRGAESTAVTSSAGMETDSMLAGGGDEQLPMAQSKMKSETVEMEMDGSCTGDAAACHDSAGGNGMQSMDGGNGAVAGLGGISRYQGASSSTMADHSVDDGAADGEMRS